MMGFTKVLYYWQRIKTEKIAENFIQPAFASVAGKFLRQIFF